VAASQTQNTKYCTNCGAQIDARAEFCPKCGVRIAQPLGAVQPPPPSTTQHKNEGLAAILSLIFVGLGQIYNGQIGKGILFIIIGAIFVILFSILIGFLLYFVFWVFNIYDAYNTAKKINAGLIKT
jgi:TM2 domain-containing membrane protein YozV